MFACFAGEAKVELTDNVLGILRGRWTHVRLSSSTIEERRHGHVASKVTTRFDMAMMIIQNAMAMRHSIT